MREVGSQADFLTTFSETAFRLLLSMSRRERIRDRARQAMGVLKAFASEAPGALRHGLIWSPRRGAVDFTVPQFAT